MGAGCLALFGLPFLAAGLVITGLYFGGIIDWVRAAGWEETPCAIVSVTSERGDEDTRKTTAEYTYRYQGREYRGDRVSFYHGGDNVGDFQQRAYRELSHHRGGPMFRCYVNPRDPSESVLYRTIRWPMQAFLAVFALTFPAVGGGLVIGGILAVLKSKREKRLRELNPDEPWKWREDWQRPVIPEGGGGARGAVYGYTLWAALVIFPMLAAVAASGAFEDDPKAWLLMIYPALWCVPAAISLKYLRQRWALGRIGLETKRRPVRAGETMEGQLVLSKPLPVRSEAELELVCEEVTTQRDSDGTSTRRRKIWSHTEVVPDEELIRDVRVFRMPVRFQIPVDAPDGTLDGTNDKRHEWKLLFRIPGTSHKAGFELPVVAGEGEAGDAPVALRMETEPEPEDLARHLKERKIIAEFGRDHTPQRLDFPPARHLGAIAGLFVFLLIWTAASVFLIVKEAPWLFRIVWPGSSALLWAWWIWMVLHRRTVDVEPSALVIRHRFGPVRWLHRLAKDEISGFSHGSNMTSNNTNFYRVRVRSTGGKTFTIADGITDRRMAAELEKRFETWWKS